MEGDWISITRQCLSDRLRPEEIPFPGRGACRFYQWIEISHSSGFDRWNGPSSPAMEIQDEMATAIMMTTMMPWTSSQ